MPRLPDPRSTVLFVCDVQERFRSAIYGFDQMSSIIHKMVQAAKLLEIPVLATEQNPKALGSTVPELGLSALPETLNLGMYPKTKFSMLLPETQSIIQNRSTKSIILTGIESHVCVLQTTLDCLEQGLSVYVLADGVSSCNRQETPVALDLMRQAGAVITTSESILFQLVGDASNTVFKPFAALVKQEKENTKTALTTLLPSPPKSAM